MKVSDRKKNIIKSAGILWRRSARWRRTFDESLKELDKYQD